MFNYEHIIQLVCDVLSVSLLFLLSLCFTLTSLGLFQQYSQAFLACLGLYESWWESCTDAEVSVSLLPQLASARASGFHVVRGLFFNPFLCQVSNSAEHLKIISFNMTCRECYSIIFVSSVLKKLVCIWNGELDKQYSLEEGTECAAHVYPPCHVC